MTHTEALRLALEALEMSDICADDCKCTRKRAINGIKAALEAKDEPVATKNNDGVTLHLGWDDLPVGTKLYATPPQRKPLTDEEIGAIAIKSQDGISPHDDTLRFARAIEAKLRSKNHD